MTKRARCIVVEHNRELSKTQPITHPACASCTSTRHTRKLPERSAGKLVPLFVDQPSHAGSVKRACVLLPGVRCSDGIRDRAQGRCAHFVLQHTSANDHDWPDRGAFKARNKRGFTLDESLSFIYFALLHRCHERPLLRCLFFLGGPSNPAGASSFVTRVPDRM